MNDVPTLNPIGDQTISHSQQELDIVLAAVDLDGDTLNYTAEVTPDPLETVAYELDQQYRLSALEGVGYYTNVRGFVEKYLLGVYSGGNKQDNPLPVVQIIDDRGQTFTSTGFATTTGQGFGNDVQYAAAGNGSAVARWSFDNLTASQCRISAIWSTQANRATDAPFVIRDGAGNQLGIASLNQEASPADFVDANVIWRDLGTLINFNGGSLIVELSNAADEFVIADAIRIERISEWFFLLPDGSLHHWEGSIEGSPVIATLDETYYADPSRLHESQLPLVSATAEISDGTLTITQDDGFAGRFQVTVTASDGVATTSDSFKITVTNAVQANNESVDNLFVNFEDSLMDGLLAV